MKTKILLTLLIIFSFFLSKSAVVSMTDAAKVAQKVFPLSQISPLKVTSQYYVFSVLPKGFVIISAEDAAKPILGYSAESDFIGNREQEFYLSQVALQIDWIRTANAPALTAEWMNPFSNNRSAVSPLLTTTWAQDATYNGVNYNDSCNAGKGYVTGCVATAMAQLMKFWNYPSVGTGFHSYNDVPPFFQNNIGVISANFGVTQYEWANMPNASPANAIQTAALAQLMKHCGVGVEMDYGPESLAYVTNKEAGKTANAQRALYTYFGYDSAQMKTAFGSSITAALVNTDLSAGHPGLLEGSGSGGGHCWVVDGIDANGLLHMNWGWGGVDNGYYAIGNFNPYVSFNGSIGMVYNIVPKGATSVCSVPVITINGITTTSAHINVGNGTLFDISLDGVIKVIHTNDTTLSGFQPNSTHTISAQQICTSGLSGYSASQSFTTLPAQSCNAPANVQAAGATDSSVTISWTGVANYLSYNIEIRIQGTSAWTVINLSANFDNITGLFPSTTYEFAVQTVCSSGSSAYTNFQTFTTSAGAISCEQQTATGATNIDTASAILHWKQGANQDTLKGTTPPYFEVYLTKSDGTWDTTYFTSSFSYLSAGLTPNTHYQYRVDLFCTPTDSSGWSNWSYFTTLAIPVPPPPPVPADTTCSDSYEPNNDMDNATPIVQNTIYHSMIANATDTDVYIIQTDTMDGTNIYVSLFNLPVNLALKLLNADGEIKKSSDYGGTQSEELSYSTKVPQTWYIMVKASPKKSYVYSGYGCAKTKTPIPNFTDTACYSLEVTTTKSKLHKCGDDGDIGDEVIPVVLYPNPAHNYITLSGSIENPYYQIINTLGQTVLSGVYQENVINFSLDNGVYILRIDGQSIIFVVQ